MTIAYIIHLTNLHTMVDIPVIQKYIRNRVCYRFPEVLNSGQVPPKHLKTDKMTVLDISPIYYN